MRKIFIAIKIILHLPIDIWQMFITYLPGRIGELLRYIYWKKRLSYLGKNVKIDVGVYFQNPEFISLDDKCWIDRNVIILAGKPRGSRITYERGNPDFILNIGEVYIGKFTHIAPNCVLSGIGGLYIGKNSGVASNSTIYSFSHHYRNLVDRKDTNQYSFTPLARQDQQSMILSPVVISDYCAIGLNSVILPGASLKIGSWIASNSTISKRYPEQSLIYEQKVEEVKSLSNYQILK
jgi:acetyltransferase-like isoleucine patch superfamily enzyme